MAERARAAGDLESAGQYRHAAMLAFQNILRWRRTAEGPWKGSFFVTKNHFDPALRVGHQAASEYTNYGGSLMFHLAEAYHAREHEIPERPSPSEIGGYALRLDPEFATAFANAGGMQIQVNLRGQLEETHTKRWTPLGVVRVARVGWETRLGPSDGVLTNEGGVSLAPTFLEQGRWLRLADLSDRYEGKWSVDFVHPLLVRCSVTYAPKAGKSGPVFVNDFVITPDGVLSTVRKTSQDDTQWGVTWPLIENDGRPLKATVKGDAASVSYPGGNGDEQNFLSLGTKPLVVSEDRTFRSTFGDLRAIRVTTSDPSNRTFIYPRSADDPSGSTVRSSFKLTPDGFASNLALVKGDTYVGRTSAGGVAKDLDLDGDGTADVTFDKPCGFLIQLRDGKPFALEVDRDVNGAVGRRKLTFRAHEPLDLR
jgi:hypothetical protein